MFKRSDLFPYKLLLNEDKVKDSVPEVFWCQRQNLTAELRQHSFLEKQFEI